MAQFPSSQPKTFLKYNLTSFLGSGCFGVVWEMVGREEEKASALKIILADEEKQKRELEISPKLDHDNLVKVFSIERKEVTPAELDPFVPQGGVNCDVMIRQLRRNESFSVFCITLELCGENLRKWLNEEHDGASTTTNVTQLGIVKGIVEGLKYLHEKNIIHRDLKPENVMFSTKGYLLPVKIGDYGTCRILKDRQTSTSTLTSWIGTPLYSAPETSSNDYGLHIDVFSLGLITWEVLQLLPFWALKDHFYRLVYKKQKELVNLNPCFQGLTKIIIKMVRRNVERRLKNLEEIIINLTDCSLGADEFVARNSKELEHLLKACRDGARILLREGVYEGEFVIRKREMTLIGCGEKTILSPSAGTYVLTILEEHFRAENLKIDGKRGKNIGGIRVEGDNCSLENLTVCNIRIPRGAIHKCTSSMNTKISNVRFEDVYNPLFVKGESCTLSNININKCKIGIWAQDVKSLLVQSVSISNPRKCGIEFEGMCKTSKIVDVQITAEPYPTSFPFSPIRAIRVVYCCTGELELRNVNCSGFDGELEGGLFIDINSLSVDIQITDCNLGKVFRDVSRREQR